MYILLVSLFNIHFTGIFFCCIVVIILFSSQSHRSHQFKFTAIICNLALTSWVKFSKFIIFKIMRFRFLLGLTMTMWWRCVDVRKEEWTLSDSKQHYVWWINLLYFFQTINLITVLKFFFLMFFVCVVI